MKEGLVHNNLNFLKILEKFTLESKLLVCQKYSSRIMSCSMVDMTKAYYENIMPWEIEAFAAYSIVYDNENATAEIDGETFANTITLIRNYWHNGLTEAENSGQYPEVFMMISALQQFPVQGVFLQKLYRYHYFFTFQNEKINMKKVFFDKIGVNYESLEVLAFLIFIGFSKEAHDTISALQLESILTKAFSDKEVLSVLSIEKEDYKKKLSSLYQDNIIDQYYGLKIQYVYPFISGKDFIYLPSPYLVINAVTESMLNRVTFNDNEIRRAVGKEVIESYVYKIISQLSTVTWTTPELVYYKGKDKKLSPDVISAEDDKVIFYEAKAITPSLKLRKFDAAEIEKNIEIYAKDIIQLYNQIKNYLQGLFQLDKTYLKDNIFGIVIVLEDAVVSREKVYHNVFEILRENDKLSEDDKNYICSHIKILSLRAIECMVLQNISLLPVLLSQLDKPEKWYDYTYSNSTADNDMIPSYAQYEREIKTRVKKYILREKTKIDIPKV